MGVYFRSHQGGGPKKITSSLYLYLHWMGHEKKGGGGEHESSWSILVVSDAVSGGNIFTYTSGQED